jgi:NAD(P)H-hydrate epimerase
VADIQHDRFAAVREIAVSFGGVCVLKGSGSLIAQDGDPQLWLCDRGNPGMASGGSGDVLTGVIAALCAQGLRPLDAARLGVWLHASAGDAAAAQAGEIGMLASDLFPFLRAGMNSLLDPCR